MTLGVAAAAEGIMSSSELPPDLPEVIVFAVTGNSDALFRAGHRLVSGGREVDDRQPRMGRDPPGRQPQMPSSSGPRCRTSRSSPKARFELVARRHRLV